MQEVDGLQEIRLSLAVLAHEKDLAGTKGELAVLQVAEVEESQPLKAHQSRVHQSSCMGMMMFVYPSSGDGFRVTALFTSLNSMAHRFTADLPQGLAHVHAVHREGHLRACVLAGQLLGGNARARFPWT